MASEPFPVYPSIEPNVRFWIKAYTQYPTTKGIIHDSRNLDVIYEVIDLLPPEKEGARKINKKRIKKAKNKYKKILKKLARTGAASDPEAKRVAVLFGPNATRATFRKAMHRVRYQLGQRDRFEQGLIRSGAFIEEIKAIFRFHGLPEDLAYLPHVESSFNPRAYSKFGAAGMWQFTRATGKRFMTVDYALDERRDPIRSSEAAAKLLKRDYEKLGSWPMAITAYNHGIAGMRRAKRRRGSYEAIFKNYRTRRFRFASRNFYSEFLAAREAAKNFERYFGMLELDEPVKTREVHLEGYASVTDLSRCFEVNVETIRRLNPALRPPVFKEQKYVPKGYALRLPADAVQDLQVASTKLSREVYKSRQKHSRFYRVKRGDTLGEIAQRHGLKVSDLILANNLNARGTIYVNQNLRLPVSGEKPGRAGSARASAPQLASANQSGSPRPPAVLTQDAHSTFEATISASQLSINPALVAGNLEVERVINKESQRIGIIRVEIEETLGHYAEWLKIPTRQIRRLNGFRYGRVLRLHQKVKIPLDRVSKEQFEEARFEYHQEIQEDFFGTYQVETLQVYRVKNGDNIWTLCNEVFNIPLWLVKKYNPGLDFSDLRWSQRLAIPVVQKRDEGPTGALTL
jgi:membrane-bound lytic murein transglycosylase D